MALVPFDNLGIFSSIEADDLHRYASEHILLAINEMFLYYDR